MFKRNDIVIIEWIDASYGHNQDFEDGEYLEPVNLVTIGFVIADKEDFITLSAEYNPDDLSTRHQMSVIKSNIKKITKVKKHGQTGIRKNKNTSHLGIVPESSTDNKRPCGQEKQP
jgi:hypothetical protein